MKISFGNMTVELNIFNINNQPLNYDEIHPMCLIEEITDDFGFEGPKIECFTQEEDDLDFDRQIKQDDMSYEPSLEDPEIECFAQYGGNIDFYRLLEPSLEDSEIECFAQCGGNIDFYRLLEPTRIIVEPSLEDPKIVCFAQYG